MFKFVSILITVLSLNFMVSYHTTDLGQLQEIGVEFSKKAVGIESGQPVFTKDTKICISSPQNEKVNLYINEEKKEINNGRIELSGLDEGTYTVLIVPEGKSKSEQTVGFTIQ